MDKKRLCQWLDREMDEAAAEAFLASLSESERQEARAFWALTQAAAQIPEAVPSEDFAARAMARVKTRHPPRRSLWTWLRAPSFSPVGALAGAVALAIGVFGFSQWRFSKALDDQLASFEQRVAGEARSFPAQVVARLSYRAPQAREVAVAGDFNGWTPEVARMRRGVGGNWTVEIPLSSGTRYQYMFVVDGQWVSDPHAPITVDDGFGGKNAVLDL